MLSDSLASDSGKMTLLNFYATWCRPCVREIPDLLELQQKHPDKLRLMMVSIDDQNVVENVLPGFLQDKNINFPTWYAYGDKPASSQLIFSLYPEWNSSIPLSLLYDGSGNLIQAFVGQIDPALLNSRIERNTR